jgi:hypothetical protein
MNFKGFGIIAFILYLCRNILYVLFWVIVFVVLYFIHGLL